MMTIKRTTTTTKILDALHAPGIDFLDVRMLVEITGESSNRVTAALHWLRKVRSVDVVVNADGTGWWFALPPDEDARIRTIDEIKDGIQKPKRRIQKKQRKEGA